MACAQYDLNIMTYLFLEGSERLMKMGIEILIDTLTNFEDNSEAVCHL